MADAMLATIKSIGTTVTDDSIRALDLRSREAIEALTTDTAKEIASFLYDRDSDIRQAAALDPSEASFAASCRTSARHSPARPPGSWPTTANPGFRKYRSSAKPR
jgi:hypothetical protein